MVDRSSNFSLVDRFGFDSASGIATPVEYVWIGGTGTDIRSKTKLYQRNIESIGDLEEWNYDGSSTLQATTEASEIILKPVALFRDPYRSNLPT
jgi:glutamine synthetase